MAIFQTIIEQEGVYQDGFIYKININEEYELIFFEPEGEYNVVYAMIMQIGRDEPFVAQYNPDIVKFTFYDRHGCDLSLYNESDEYVRMDMYITSGAYQYAYYNTKINRASVVFECNNSDEFMNQKNHMINMVNQHGIM